MFKEIWDLVPKEFKNKWFVIFLVSLISALLVLNRDISKTFNVVFLFILLFSLFLYNINVKLMGIFEKTISWLFLLLIFLFSLGYTAALLHEINIAAISLIIGTLLMVIIPLIMHLSNLWRSKNIPILVLSYTFVVFLLILFFAPVYELSGIFDGSGLIKVKDNTKLESNLEYIYFSASVFYANLFGDILPINYSKLVVIIELVISSIFHIIVLGIIISKFSAEPKK